MRRDLFRAFASAVVVAGLGVSATPAQAANSFVGSCQAFPFYGYAVKYENPLPAVTSGNVGSCTGTLNGATVANVLGQWYVGGQGAYTCQQGAGHGEVTLQLNGRVVTATGVTQLTSAKAIKFTGLSGQLGQVTASVGLRTPICASSGVVGASLTFGAPAAAPPTTSNTFKGTCRIAGPLNADVAAAGQFTTARLDALGAKCTGTHRGTAWTNHTARVITYWQAPSAVFACRKTWAGLFQVAMVDYSTSTQIGWNPGAGMFNGKQAFQGAAMANDGAGIGLVNGKVVLGGLLPANCVGTTTTFYSPSGTLTFN